MPTLVFPINRSLISSSNLQIPLMSSQSDPEAMHVNSTFESRFISEISNFQSYKLPLIRSLANPKLASANLESQFSVPASTGWTIKGRNCIILIHIPETRVSTPSNITSNYHNPCWEAREKFSQFSYTMDGGRYRTKKLLCFFHPPGTLLSTKTKQIWGCEREELNNTI